MAKEIIVDFKIETGAAVREVESLKEEIKDVNKEVVDGNKKTEKSFEGVQKASDKTAGGVRKIGVALKAIGIGLIIAAFAKFTEVLNQNQKVVDFFNTTFETLSILFNDVIGSVIKAVSSFDNFKASIGRVFDNIQTLLNPACVRLQKLIKV